MTLSLQDLLVGFDAGTPQGARANAPAPRGTPHNSDPFAALFAANANPAPTPRATQPSATADTARQRPERSAGSDAIQANGHAAKTADKAADKAIDKVAPAANRASRTDDDVAAKDPSTSTDSRADDASSDQTDSDVAAAAVTSTPAGVAPAIANVFQVALLVSEPVADTGNKDAAAQAAAITRAPGLKIASVVASATALPAADGTAPPASNSDLSNPIAELLANAEPKQVASAHADASVFAALTTTDPAGQSVDPATPAAKTTDPTNTTPTDNGAVIAPTTDAQTKAGITTATPAAPASAVAQVAVQAPRAAGATAEAVAQVARPNDAVSTTPPAAATAQLAAQTARPTDATGKIAAPRAEGSNKPAAHGTTKSTNDESTTAAATPAKDTAPAFAVAPAAPGVDETPIANVVAAPAPVIDGDAPAPAQDAPAATAPIAAPAAPQAHQLYAQAAARGPSLPQLTVDQVVAHVAKAADDGIDHLTIQLKPAHLGAIEVKLEMHDDGGLAKATISADRPDTLDLLQRDSHRLERALENAGIKADAGSLSFNLRGDGGRHQPGFAQDQAPAPSRPTFHGDDSGVEPAVMAYLNARAALGGVDIRV